MQDEALEALGKGVDRLNDLGSAINVELKDQEKMLGGLSGDMDEAEGKMNMVNHYLKKLLNTKDSCQYGTIVVLGKCMKQFFPLPFCAKLFLLSLLSPSPFPQLSSLLPSLRASSGYPETAHPSRPAASGSMDKACSALLKGL